MIDAACAYEKSIKGPAAYYLCLTTELEKLERHGGRPDLSGLGRADQEMIDAACAYEKSIKGPAAYYLCLDRQISLLVP